MGLVRLFNDNIHPYKATYKGEEIVIPAKKFIEMENEDAVNIRGMMLPIRKDGMGNFIPETFSMLRIIPLTETAPAKDTNKPKCFQCGYQALDDADLDEHVDRYHLDEMADQKVANARRKRRAELDVSMAKGKPTHDGAAVT